MELKYFAYVNDNRETNLMLEEMQRIGPYDTRDEATDAAIEKLRGIYGKLPFTVVNGYQIAFDADPLPGDVVAGLVYGEATTWARL